MNHFLARCLVPATLLLAAMGSAHAQAPGGPPAAGGPPGMPPVGPLKVHSLSPTVYWVEGGVGNTGFIIGSTGVVVVDTTISEAGGKLLLAEIAKVTPKPVTTVILTHGDADHVGGLAAFPAGVTVIAHPANKARMEAGVAAGRSRVPADRLPSHTVASREVLDRDGVKIEVLHWAPAHTDGDLVVFLPEQKVVFTGDIFAMNQFRALIHDQQGGTSEGWGTSTKAMLALDADRYVVGHGDLHAKPALQERVKLVMDERAKIRQLVGQGKSLAQIQAEVGDPPPAQATAPGEPRFPPFSAVVYQELSGPAKQ